MYPLSFTGEGPLDGAAGVWAAPGTAMQQSRSRANEGAHMAAFRGRCQPNVPPPLPLGKAAYRFELNSTKPCGVSGLRTGLATRSRHAVDRSESGVDGG